MKTFFSRFKTSELRSILIEETKKFVLALKYGATVSDLEELIESRKTIEEILREREKPESRHGENNLRKVESGDDFGQVG